MPTPKKKQVLEVTTTQRVVLSTEKEEQFAGWMADAINDTGKVFFQNWSVYDLDPAETYEAEVKDADA